MNIYQEFWESYNKEDHKALARWAIDCAKRVLPLFVEKYPHEKRPQQALEVLEEWIKTGEFKMSVIRKASLDSHAAAREVEKEDEAACFVARACGQTVATAHVPAHAIGASYYALKAIKAVTPNNADAAVDKERDWQLEHLPKQLHGYMQSVVKAKKGLKV